MIVYVKLSNGRVVGYSSIEETGSIPFNVDLDFLNNWTNYIVKDGQLVVDNSEQDIDQIRNKNIEYQKFLDETDWKVTRHRDQLEQGIPTRLTDVEFEELLCQRQCARDSIIKV